MRSFGEKGLKKSRLVCLLFFDLSRSAYFFGSSIIFLHSAFILSSIFGSIFLHAAIFSAFSLSVIAPPCAAAKEPTDAQANVTATNAETNLLMDSLLGVEKVDRPPPGHREVVL